MSNFSQFMSGGIKSIQRGVITVANGGNSGSSTITAVNPLKTELRLLGVDGVTAGDAIPYSLPGRIRLADSTTVQFNSVAPASNAAYVSWELTEWK